MTLNNMKEYGSHNIGELFEYDLLDKSKKLIPALFSINNKGGIIGEKKYQKILDLFEIIKFSKENYPYLLTLKFNDDKLLKKVNIWKDPHYSMINNERSAFVNRKYSFPDLTLLANNQKMLISTFKEILESPFDIDRLANTIIIAGSEDIILNIGSACKTFFDNKLLKPVF